MTEQPKSKIFISHANPNDNYFALWLSTKLQIMGFQTWVDIAEVTPGGYFNQLYEAALRHEAIIFVPVLTNAYIVKAGLPDTGVANEISLARTIGKQTHTHNFIVPVLLDQNVSYSDFPVGIIDRDTISFAGNWGAGLQKLVGHLNDLKVLRVKNSPDVLHGWYNFLNIDPAPVEKKERYYSNWLPVELPQQLNVFKCEHSLIPKNFPYPYITESYYVIGFFPESTLNDFGITALKKWSFRTDDFRNQNVDLHEFKIVDAFKKLVKLLNSAIAGYVPIAKARKYEMANEHFCYFFSSGEGNIERISLEHIGKNRRIIVGKSKGNMWHFGLSFQAVLHPLTAFRVSYHVLFSDAKTETLHDKKAMQKLRKASTTDWYNQKWFETMAAFLYRYSNFASDYKISIPVSEEDSIKIDTVPLGFEANIGYHEPSSNE